MNQEFYEAVEANPVIAAVKNDAGLQAAVEMEEIQVIFVLYGDVCTIPEILERIKAAGKKAMVHIDLIAGLSAKEISVEFIARQTRADGIITTKPALVRRAKELGIFAVLRFFVIDSLALKNIENLEMQCGPETAGYTGACAANPAFSVPPCCRPTQSQSRPVPPRYPVCPASAACRA